jgi:hypothetical protein
MLFAPSGLAQTDVAETELSLGAPSLAKGEIRPGLEQTRLTIPFEWKPAFVGPGNLPAAAGGIPLEITIGTCDANIIVLGTFNRVISYEVQNTGPATGNIELQIALRPDAPGLELLACEIRAQTTGGGGGFYAASPLQSSRFSITGSYVPQLQAVVSGKIAQGGPQKEVHYPITITNFGNAKTVVIFDLPDKPTGGKWAALPPENLILNSEQSGLQFERAIDFVVATTYKNGWNNEQGQYRLTMQPVAFLNEQVSGIPTSVNILTKVRGVYVPVLEPLLMIGAVLGTGLLARLRD